MQYFTVVKDCWLTWPQHEIMVITAISCEFFQGGSKVKTTGIIILIRNICYVGEDSNYVFFKCRLWHICYYFRCNYYIRTKGYYFYILRSFSQLWCVIVEEKLYSATNLLLWWVSNITWKSKNFHLRFFVKSRALHQTSDILDPSCVLQIVKTNDIGLVWQMLVQNRVVGC
jgi:hypothetical protein